MTPSDPRLDAFVRLYDSGEYFEAHDVLEELWAEQSGPLKHFLQALIQIAVATYHLEGGNRSGFASLLGKARVHLAACPDRVEGFEVQPVLAMIERLFALEGRIARTDSGELDPEGLPKMREVLGW